MPSETPNLQEIADDLEAQIHECCDSDDGDAVCHRCGVRMNAVDALRAAHQERDADARRLERLVSEWLKRSRERTARGHAQADDDRAMPPIVAAAVYETCAKELRAAIDAARAVQPTQDAERTCRHGKRSAGASTRHGSASPPRPRRHP